MKIVKDFYLSKNFKISEFVSPDNNTVTLDYKLIEKLQLLRDIVGVPVNINSGYRTPDHNRTVGGYAYSKHMLGQAADVSKLNLDIDDDTLIRICANIGFTGIGIYNTHIHLDVGEYNNPNMGSYHFWDFRTNKEE